MAMLAMMQIQAVDGMHRVYLGKLEMDTSRTPENWDMHRRKVGENKRNSSSESLAASSGVNSEI